MKNLRVEKLWLQRVQGYEPARPDTLRDLVNYVLPRFSVALIALTIFVACYETWIEQPYSEITASENVQPILPVDNSDFPEDPLMENYDLNQFDV